MAEVLGSSPTDSPFGLVLLSVVYNIYILLYLAVALETSPTIYNCGYSWRGLPNLVESPTMFFKFHSRVVHVHLLPATRQPLIGPFGGLSLGHASPYQVITPHQSYKMYDSMWHDPIDPRIDPKRQKSGDMWQPLGVPFHHADISMPHVTFFLLPPMLYGR
jgi:hypothetical protein